MSEFKGKTEIVVYGRRAVREALADPAVEVLELRVARSVGAPFLRLLRAAVAARPGNDLRIAPCGEGEVRALSEAPRHDQGVAARVRLPRVMEVEAFIATTKGSGARHSVRSIALDGVTNSQNVGMIVRSALAAGVDAMLWPLRGSPWINGLVVKASASAIYRCPIVRCHSLAEGLHALKAAGFQIVGLASDAPLALFDYTPPHRAVFVVGSETRGVSAEIGALVDQWLAIPMQGGVESLNVAVAASLLCFTTAPVRRSEAGSALTSPVSTR